MAIPISQITEAKLASELSAAERENIAAALNLDPLTKGVKAVGDGSVLLFTFGVPFMVLIDGQKVDNWTPTNGWDSVNEVISNIPHKDEAFIEVIYRAKY